MSPCRFRAASGLQTHAEPLPETVTISRLPSKQRGSVYLFAFSLFQPDSNSAQFVPYSCTRPFSLCLFFLRLRKKHFLGQVMKNLNFAGRAWPVLRPALLTFFFLSLFTQCDPFFFFFFYSSRHHIISHMCISHAAKMCIIDAYVGKR